MYNKTTTAEDTINVMFNSGNSIIKKCINKHQYKIHVRKIIIKNGRIFFEKTIIPNKIFKQITKRKLIKVKSTLSNGAIMYKITNKGLRLVSASWSSCRWSCRKVMAHKINT